MPKALPVANALYSETWRLPLRTLRLSSARNIARHLLRRMLLGTDGITLCRRRDERVMGRIHRIFRSRGKGNPVPISGSTARRPDLYFLGRFASSAPGLNGLATSAQCFSPTDSRGGRPAEKRGVLLRTTRKASTADA